MEFLKDVLGGELFPLVAEKLQGSRVKLADLSGGDYVSREKFEALESERDSLKRVLSEANAQIDAFKSMDIDGIRKAAEEWKEKAEAAQKEAEAKIKSLQFEFALERALNGVHARDPRVVKPLLNRRKLSLTEDGIDGLKEQLDALLLSHPYLFDIPDSASSRIMPGGVKLSEASLRENAAFVRDPFLLGFND